MAQRVRKNTALMKRALSLYDEGIALPYVIERVLSSAGDRQLEVAATFVKAALVMSDCSVRRIHTPIKKEIGPGCFHVGDTIISIVGSPCEGNEGEKRQRILLWITKTWPADVLEDSLLTTCYKLTHFVAQMATLRAMGSNRVIREWLAALPL